MRRPKLTLWIGLAVLPCTMLAQTSPPPEVPTQAAPAPPQNVLRLTVSQAEQIAIKDNPEVTVARLAAMTSHELWRERRSALLPTVYSDLTGVGTNNGNRISAGGLNNPVLYERAAYGVTVAQLITDFGRTTNLVAGARFREQAENENSVATTNQIKLAADRAFYDALGAQSVLTVARQTVASRQLLSDQVTTLEKHKLKSSLDVSFANTNLDQAQLLLLDSENQYNAALAVLAEVLGIAGPQNFELIDEAPPTVEPPSPDVAQLISAAYGQRPELRAEDLLRQADLKMQNAARDQYFPRIEALGVVGEAPVRSDPISAWYGAVGVNVQIPIFTGFRIAAQTREAQLQTQAESERITGLKNVISRDVRKSWLAANTNYRRISVTAALLDETKLALDLAQTRYRLGLGTIVEVSQAQLAETQAEIDSAKARYNYLLSQALIRFETGSI